MNYRYNIGKENFIVSEEEHQKIIEAIKKDRNGVVILRGGSMILGLSMLNFAKETHEPTDEQVKQRDRNLKLTSPKPKVNDFLSRTKAEFYKKMKWDDTPTKK